MLQKPTPFLPSSTDFSIVEPFPLFLERCGFRPYPLKGWLLGRITMGRWRRHHCSNLAMRNWIEVGAKLKVYQNLQVPKFELSSSPIQVMPIGEQVLLQSRSGSEKEQLKYWLVQVVEKGLKYEL